MLDALLDLVLPRCCAGCARTGPALCSACHTLLHAPALGPWRPDPCPPGLPPVHALAPYAGQLKAVLLAHKEHGRLSLTRPLGEAVARTAWPLLEAAHAEPLVLCPVPSSAAAVRQRGYDHTLRLARAAARTLRAAGRPTVASALLRPARVVTDQAGLGAAERAANLHGAMRGRGLLPARVLLVDDLVTTGATLQEASRALAADGHRVLGAAVLGATHRWAASGPRVPLHQVPDGG